MDFHEQGKIILNYPPHGACWLWNDFLIALHLIGDLGIGIYYVIIPITIAFIYRHGKLKKLKESLPRLWSSGALFILLCGLTHFCAAVEIWIGGWFYYISGSIKILTLLASSSFAYQLLNHRWQIVAIGRVVEAINEEKST